jgi:hypothetical protein
MKVMSIDTYECKDWLLHKHYAKRIPPIEYSFGLFDDDFIMQGVCTFGTPVSHTLRSLWDDFKLLELNRLVVNEGLPKNSLSFFVSQCLNQIPKPKVIVSYADTSQNHNGYIYQATNWIYTGLSAKFKDIAVKGLEHQHHSTIEDLARGKENRREFLREKFGDRLYHIERPRKHRYFYFIGSKKQKKKMLKNIPYEIKPYPKGKNKRYDASYKPQVQLKII